MKNPSTGAAKSPTRKPARTFVIASLNDKCRTEQDPDNTYLSLSITQKGDSFVKKALSQIADTSIPLLEGDTDDEKGHGSTVVDGIKLNWSIDYFDLEEESDSPDAANPNVTVRTLTAWID